jgi:hypothetical protein
MSRWAVVAMMLLGAACWFGLTYGLGHHEPPPPPAAQADAAPPEPPQPPEPPSPPTPAERVQSIIATLFMVVAMAALGRVLSWLFSSHNLLPPVLILAGVVDIWGVTKGPVRQMAEHSMATIQKASAAMPAVKSAAGGAFGLTDLSIGPGDLAVAALVLAVVLGHGLDLRRNLIFMYVLTVAGLALALATSLLVPGLVFIGLAGVVANWRHFRYSAQERRDLVVASLLIALLLGVATLVGRHGDEAPPPTGADENHHGPDQVRPSGD